MGFIKDVFQGFVESDKNLIGYLLGKPNNATKKQKKIWDTLLLLAGIMGMVGCLRVFFSIQPMVVNLLVVVVLVADFALVWTNSENASLLYHKPTFLLALCSGVVLSFVGFLYYLSYAVTILAIVMGLVQAEGRPTLYRVLAAFGSGMGGYLLGFCTKYVIIELIFMVILIIFMKYMVFGMTLHAAACGVGAVMGVAHAQQPRSAEAQSVLDSINDEGVKYVTVVDEVKVKEHLERERLKLKSDLENIAYRNRHGK